MDSMGIIKLATLNIKDAIKAALNNDDIREIQTRKDSIKTNTVFRRDFNDLFYPD